MARRRSFLAQLFADQNAASAQGQLEQRRVAEHVARSRERREQAERVRVERDRAQADGGRTQARLAAEAREQSEVLRYHLRRLEDVLSERDPGSPALVARLEAVRQDDGDTLFAAALGTALSASDYPPSIPTRTRVAYRPAARELVCERELPGHAVVPAEREYRVVRDEVRAVPRTPAEVRGLYGQLLARVALRTVAETFALTAPDVVDRVVLDGRLTAVDSVTGRPGGAHVLNAVFTRGAFAGLELDAPGLDPELCLRAHRAVVVTHPADPRRLDLLTVAPTEFETLVRQLFQARGLQSWQTHESTDGGVDAVAVHEHPLLGGLAVISARRSPRVVPADAVRALAGAMHERAAATGILVTTSWVGRESRDLARRLGRIHIIEGRELKQMLAESLNLDVLISLPVLPPGWERAHVA